MYTYKDLKDESRTRILTGCLAYIDDREHNHQSVCPEEMYRQVTDQFQFTSNIEYEKWLFTQFGFDLAINLLQYKNKSIPMTEKFFCKKLALAVNEIMTEIVIEDIYRRALVSQKNYTKHKALTIKALELVGVNDDVEYMDYS